MTKFDVKVGESWDAKYYTVHLSEDRKPVMVEASFYGYRGRLTYRPVKEGGVAWRRAVAAAIAQTPNDKARKEEGKR